MNDIDRLLAAADRVAEGLERLAPLLERAIAADEATAALLPLLAGSAPAGAEAEPFVDYRDLPSGWQVRSSDGVWRPATPAEVAEINAMRERRR
jgi:hypothetical protein